MVGLAFGEAGATGSAGAAFARACEHVALLAKRIQNGNAGCDFVALAAFGEFDLEGPVVRMGCGCPDEILEVHGGIRPMTGHVADRVHQAARPATIEMSAALFFQHGPEVVSLIGLAIVMVENDLAGKFRSAELLAKGHRLLCPGEIVQGEVLLTLADAVKD